jgi:hypothetical protein
MTELFCFFPNPGTGSIKDIMQAMRYNIYNIRTKDAEYRREED